MVLNFTKVGNTLFPNSKDEDIGINGQNSQSTNEGGSNVIIVAGTGLSSSYDSDTNTQTLSSTSSGTKYYSMPASNWQTDDGTANQLYIDTDEITINANGISLSAAISLPHGAVITNVICYGSETDEDWYLERADITTGSRTTMATNKFNSGDSSITNATIDNQNYGYGFVTSSLSATDEVYGAVITYTI